MVKECGVSNPGADGSGEGPTVRTSETTLCFSLVLSSVDFFLVVLCVCKCFIFEVPVLNIRNPDVATKKYG